jgi:8-oxo-dGTP pyrophosphatase MutT (NUDIX family)
MSDAVENPQVGPLVDPQEVPEWMRRLVELTAEIDPGVFRSYAPLPPEGARQAAVLMLFGDHPGEPRGDVLLLRRAATLGSHAGQVAFPGGGAEPADGGPIGTALREAVEEVGLHPDGVAPVALLPPLYVPVSGFHVTPVLAHWRTPVPVRPVDPGETASVARVPLADLVDPANRFQIRHSSGYVGPAFGLPGMVVWGFTGGLLTMLLSLAGWEQPWDTSDVRELDDAWEAAEHVLPVDSPGVEVPR